jgi:single-stranded-DNA-specific exonuclease
MKSFFDLLSIAIIADMMPMTGLNYMMVKYGLQVLNSSYRVSIEVLREGKRLLSDDIGFFIAPMLNAAGRLEDATIAYNFLTSCDKREAYEYLDYLKDLNNKRKEIQHNIFLDSIEQVKLEDRVIVVADESWHEGVIGIVAANLMHKFKRPAFVFSISNGKAKGSARASGDVNLYELLSEVDSELFLGFGGHKGAAGVALKSEKLNEFRKAINALQILDTKTLYSKEATLGEVAVNDIDLELLDILEKYEPYGLINPKPKFHIEDVKLLDINYFGKEKNHTRLKCKKSGEFFEAIIFKDRFEGNNTNYKIEYSVNKNEFRGNVSAQILVDSIEGTSKN